MKFQDNNILIREVRPVDNQPLAGMIRQVFVEFGAPRLGTVYSDPSTDYLYELFREERSVLWVAEEYGKILGCGGIYPTAGLDRDTAELVKLYAHAEARGRGIGKAILLKSLDSAREFGYSKIYLESIPAFSKAIALYEKNGFRMLEHPLGETGHTSCDIWMLADLC